MMFNSRGFKAAADLKGAQLEESLLKASQVPPPQQCLFPRPARLPASMRAARACRTDHPVSCRAGRLSRSCGCGAQGGKLPIVCDTSPCLSTLKAGLQTQDLK